MPVPQALGASADQQSKGVWGRVVGFCKDVSEIAKAVFLVLASVVVLVLTWHLLGDKTVVDPIAVPEILKEHGYTSKVAANRLKDEIHRFATEALNRYTVTGLGEAAGSQGLLVGPRSINIEMGGDAPQIEVPTTGISLDTIVRFLRSFIGINHYYTLSGEFFTTGDDHLALRLRIDGEQIYISDSTVDPDQPDRLLEDAVPTVLERIQPYVIASAKKDSEPDEALRLARQIVSESSARNENVVWAHCLIGEIYRNRRQFSHAQESLDKARAINPRLPVTYVLMGLVSSDQNDFAGAIEYYSRAIDLSSQPAASIHNNRGKAYLKVEDADHALEDFDEALKIKPQNALFLYNRGIALASIPGGADRAIADFSEVIRLKPDDADAFFNRGAIRQATHEYQAAVDDFAAVIRLQSQSSDAHYSRGNAYFSLVNLDEAIADYGEVISLDKYHPRVHRARGIANYLAGSYRAAIEDLVQFAGPSPHDTIAVLWLYLAEKRLEDPDAAAKLDSRAEGLDHTDPSFRLVALFQGRRTPDKLLVDAEDNSDFSCEANFYLGEWYLIRDKAELATRMFQRAADECPQEANAHVGAKVELKRLANQHESGPSEPR